MTLIDFSLPKHAEADELPEDLEPELLNEIFTDDPAIKSKYDLKDSAAATLEGLSFSRDLLKNLKMSKKIDSDGNILDVFTAPKSAWVHNLIYMHGKKFDFTGRRYLDPIYNGPQKMVLLRTARQVEKTTFLANNTAVLSSIIPYFHSLYVSPSHMQTRTFSNDKLKPVIEGSPIIRKYLQNSRVSQQVFEKGFTNGSFIFLRSAFLSADRARGISSDLLLLDELQDILLANVPVMAQCLSHSKYAIQLFAGTPKTHENTIEQYWDRTTQCEWAVPCNGCSGATGKKWNLLDKENIGLHGPICRFCGKGLDVSVGQWQKAQKSDFYGYHMSQLMVPWIVKPDSDAWKALIEQMETYPESQFHNEVLGVPFDNATKPITRAHLLLNCDSKHHFIKNPFSLTPDEVHMRNNMMLFAGIDWGEGNDGSDKNMKGKLKNASYTVLTIGGFDTDSKFKVVFMKRFTGKETDPEYIVSYVVRVCNILGVKMIGTDWGFGWGANNSLFRQYGPNRCSQFMYLDKQKMVRKWDPIGYKFQLLRNHVISEVFHGLKTQQYRFPPLNEWETFAKDLLHVGIEYSEYQRKIQFVHKISEPDDSLHSILYCKEIAKIYHGRYS